jgi:hypothetical protein
MNTPSQCRRSIIRLGALAAVVSLGVGVGIGSFALGAAQAASGSGSSVSPTPVHTTKNPLPTPSTKIPVKPTSTLPTKGGTETRATIMCRGPFLLGTGSFVRIEARKSDRLPGNFGDDLAPGRCSLTTRLLTVTERADIFFSYAGNSNGANISLGVAASLSVCALDEDCIVSAQVEPRSSNAFNAVVNMTPSIWKRGRHPAINH